MLPLAPVIRTRRFASVVFIFGGASMHVEMLS
jgi:hypothetical protein